MLPHCHRFFGVKTKYQNIYGLYGVGIMKGRVIVDFEREEEEEKCSYNLTQVGNDTLDNEDIISLFKHIVSELMAEES